jgi:uncharacterized protein (DUF1015 family)
MKAYYGNSFQYSSVAGESEMLAKVEHPPVKSHCIGMVSEKGFGVVQIQNVTSNLAVGTLQPFLDDWLNKNKEMQIDYVHGNGPVVRLGRESNNLGLFLPAMQKSDLFKTVILEGVLPRKTFSMGEAKEKRFYLECHRIA